MLSLQAVLESGSGRDINRHKYTEEEAEQALQQPVVKALLDLCKFRNTHQAFMGQVCPLPNCPALPFHALSWPLPCPLLCSCSTHSALPYGSVKEQFRRSLLALCNNRLLGCSSLAWETAAAAAESSRMTFQMILFYHCACSCKTALDWRQLPW